ncbi:MAG: isoprenylcysteine carboxylmethyltransferase family protein [Gemmatimonadota bacterium]
MLFRRAIVAFLILPGTVAFVVPLLWLSPRGETAQRHWIAVLPLAVGFVLLLWCIRDFYVAGKGTLAPWDPPRNLVMVGLYRWSRNPMYLAVLLILAGWATLFRSLPLLIYAAIVATAFHLRVLYGEEPWLARRHGAAWSEYRGRVRRWF